MPDLDDLQPIEMFVGDTGPGILLVVVDADGEPVAIPGWSAVGATLRFVNVKTQGVTVGVGTLAIDDPDNGEITYAWGATDTTTAGAGLFDVVLRIANAAGKVITRQWLKHLILKPLPTP